MAEGEIKTGDDMKSRGPASPEKVYALMRAAGKALMLTGGNNTHSGNFAVRDTTDRGLFYVTASGAQLGALTPADVVPLRFSGVSWGDARASTESTIHRRILAVPGAEAVIHAHLPEAIMVTFDTPDHQNYLLHLEEENKDSEQLFVPVDWTGSRVLGRIPSGVYREPVGSLEMEKRIPEYLKNHQLTLVKGHGPFVRGKNLQECLHLTGVLGAAAALLVTARLRGVDTPLLSRKIHQNGASSLYPQAVHSFCLDEMGKYQTEDFSTISVFKERGQFNFYQKISPYGTGSMSEKITEKEMLYCPSASFPRGFEPAVARISLQPEPEDDWDLSLHKTIYRETNNKTCMRTFSPLASAEAMAVVAENFGMKALLQPDDVSIDYSHHRDHPVIKPIDAEAVYLNPRLGLCNSNAPFSAILDMLRWHKGACLIAGIGALGVGKVTLEQAAHHVSSAEFIARYRQAVCLTQKILQGPPVSHFEPETQ